jgi:hypothetical protein
MANDVQITIGANTENFQVGIDKAYRSLSSFGVRNKDLAAEIDRAYKQISAAAASVAGSIETSFNSLQIKSDSTMRAASANLAKTSEDFTRHFAKIGNDAETSANDVMRAFRKLNELNSTLDASVLKDEFKSLGIQSAASIEAAKIKIVNAFEEIKITGTKCPQDIVRAHEAMTVELQRLDGLLITSAEKAAAEKIAIEAKHIAEREMQLNKLRAASVNAEVQGILAAEKAAAEKKIVNEKFIADYISSFKSERSAETAALTKSVLDYEAATTSKIQAVKELAAAERATRAAAVSNFGATNNMASWAMNGEAAAAKMAGQIHAGSGFAAELKERMEGVAEPVKRVHEGISGWSLASVAAIAKIQVLYSLINNVMSLIGSMPGTAIAAIEDFNASTINSAAMIVSMQTGVKDIGKAYKEAKVYSEAVQNVLIKMDAETAASARNLRDMNTQFVQQGVLLDTNNQKQIQGFKNVANALSAITANDPNKDMQYAQEIRALKSFEDKGSNRLVQMLKAQGVTKEMYESWKASDTVLEEMGKRLQGFAAAQGDINNLWETVKSTMSTIRDEVLRGGLSVGFAEIVEKMKELSDWAKDNKEKVQIWLRDGFKDVEKIAGFIWDMRAAFLAIGEVSIYAGIALGLGKVILKVGELATAIGTMNAAANAGMLAKIAANPIAAIVALGTLTAALAIDESRTRRMSEERASAIGSVAGIPDLLPGHIKEIEKKFGPLSNQAILDKFLSQQVRIQSVISDEGEWLGDKVIFNDKLIAAASAVKRPKVDAHATTKDTYNPSKYNAMEEMFNKEINDSNFDEYDKKVGEITDRVQKFEAAFKSLSATEQAESNKNDAAFGGTIAAFKEMNNDILDNLNIKEQTKGNSIIDAFNKALSGSEPNELERKLSAINKTLADTKLHFSELSQPAIDFLKLKGIANNADIEAAFNAEKERIKTEDGDKKAKAAAIELRNVKEADIQNSLLEIDLAEKLNQISGVEALNRRLPLEQELVDVRKEFLDSMDKEKDKAGWLAANAKYMQEQMKVNTDLQKQFDRTALGGMTNAMKNYADEATNTGKQVKQVFTNAFHNIEESIVQAFQTGTFSAKAFINGIQADLIRMGVAKPVTNYIQGLLAQYTQGSMTNGVATSGMNGGITGGVNGTNGASAAASSGSNLGLWGLAAAATYGWTSKYFGPGGAWNKKDNDQKYAGGFFNSFSGGGALFLDYLSKGKLLGSDWHNTAGGISLGVDNGQLNGGQFIDQSKQKSWWRGTSSRMFDSALDNQWTEFVNRQYSSLKDAIKTQSSTIGSSITEEAMKAVNVEKIKVDLAGKSSEEQQKVINEAFRKIQSDLIEKANPAFVNLERLGEDATAAMERLTNLKLQNNSLQMQILEMQNFKESAQYLALVNEQRQNELLKLDDSTKFLQTRLWQLQDEAEQIAKLNATKDFNNNLISRSLALDGINTGLFELRIKQEQEMADAVKNHMDTAALQIVQDGEWAKAVDSVTKNVGKSIINMTEQAKTAVLNLISAQSAIANAMKGILLGQMGNLSPEAAYRQAQAAFGGVQAKLAANPADLAALGLLPGAVNDLLNASKSYNASGVGFQNDLKSALDTMAHYSETSGVTLDAAQTQIDKLEAIRIAVTDSGVVTAQSLSALVGIWDAAKAADLKKAQDDATAQTAARTAAITTNSIAANTSAVDSQMMLKAGNIAAETQKMAVGLLSSNLQYDINKDGSINVGDSILWQQIANGSKKWSSLGLPAFASGGDHAGGLRIVGERGPELEATGASRLFNADQTRGILSKGSNGENAELKEIIRHLIALVRVSQAGFSGTIDTIEKTAVDKSVYNNLRLQNAA